MPLAEGPPHPLPPPHRKARRTGAPGAMVWHELRGGMAVRRGELGEAAAPLRELRLRALESGEPQRVIPMASVVLPHAALTVSRAVFP